MQNLPYPYEKRHAYPHMKPGDVAIWERFMLKYPKRYKFVYYDFACGDHWPMPEGVAANIAEDWKILCANKIDVVGIADDFIDIIELKPRGGHKAIGQALNYELLYEWGEKPTLPTHPVIITDLELPNVRKLCEEHDIALYVV